MDYRDHVERALRYIEENLTQEINLSTLAQVSGYSKYHFLRIFEQTVGMSPAEYLRKRRITEIVRQFSRENRPLSDIAFAFGFNSKENFARAFLAEHRILPSEFKGAQNSLKLQEAIHFDRDEFSIEGEIQRLDGFDLVVFPCDEDFPPHFWNKYNARKWSQKLSGGAIVEDYGVSFWNPQKEKLEYFIGIRASEARGDPTGTVVLHIPGGDYAVFATPPATSLDFVNTIHRSWKAILGEWLPQHGVQSTGGYELERYMESSRSFTETIFIPIQPKEDTT